MSRDDFVAWDINIFFSKDFFGSKPSSADNRALYSVPLVMNHPVYRGKSLFRGTLYRRMAVFRTERLLLSSF